MGGYNKWDIYLATVEFEDEPNVSKIRPVLITGNGKAYLLAYYVTSQSPVPGYDCFVIKQWKQAGLDRPSTVRLDRHLKLKLSDIGKRLGRLSGQDVLMINFELAKIANRQ